jgi:osmotically-inducible protein OsmY
MNHRYSQDPYRSRPGVRPDQDYARNMQGRGERFGRPYEDDSPRYAREPGDMIGDEGRYAGEHDYEAYGRGREFGRDPGQYLGSYPSERGPRYYDEPQRQRGQYGAAYGNDDYRQASGQRQWQSAPYARQAQRSFAGQGSRAASSPDQGYGYGNFRQARYQGGYSQGSGYARDYDQGDFDQAFGGYSPSQGGYGDSWSGYGGGGYGTVYGQGFDEDYMGSANAPVQSGAYGQGPGGYGGGFSQGLAGRGGYGQGSGYTNYRPESQFGKGPKGYVRSDERLKEDISEKLLRDHAIDASDISVEAKNGAVTLTGSVDNRRLKHYVEDLVEDCTGVRDIDNRLTVRARDSRQQMGSGSLGGSTGQSSATGTTGSKVSTGSEDGGGARVRN